MVLTRLLNLLTMSLEEYSVKDMPPYLAVSHVWTEALFPVSNLHGKKVAMCDGLKMVLAAQEADEELSDTVYCWTDTWCIDQHDPEDKSRQIPVMGEIYKNARAVVVTVRHEFSFTQLDWDAILENLQEAMTCARDATRNLTLAAFALYRSAAISDDLERAIKILWEFDSLAWMKRVWTAQEYILAARIVCVGKDMRPFQFSSYSMYFLIFIHSVKSESPHAEPRNLYILNKTQIRHDDLTLVMGLAMHRESSYIEDEIYGLMAASGVIITPTINAPIDEIWKAWWEQSVRAGHLLWIMLPLEDMETGRNCLMPSFRHRCRSLENQGVWSTATLGPVIVHEGSVTFSGYFAGTCTIIACFGHMNSGPKLIAELVTKINGNIGLARQIGAALSAGLHTTAESEKRSQWECAFHHWRVKGKVSRTTDSKYRRMKREFGERDGIIMNRFSSGKMFLATVRNSLKTTPILIVADGQIPEGRLVAVDINAKLGSDERDERHVFMILSVPPGGEKKGRTLHKVGISSAVFVPKNRNLERARQMNGHVFDGPVERFLVGGRNCWYCSLDHKESSE